MTNREPERELRITDDGSHTLYLPSMDEHYHSHFGAITESEFIFINTGLRFCMKEDIRVLEAGFGTGLNALLTAMEAEASGRHIFYFTVEKYPLAESITDALNYGSLKGARGAELFGLIHAAAWNEPVAITPFLTIEKREADLTSYLIPGTYDIVFFDAFGPDKQPEMWTEEIIKKISGASHSGTVFVTYSAKGSLKRSLRSSGFSVEHLPGPPGKRAITRAVKI